MNDRTDERHPEDRAIEQAWEQVMATGSELRLASGGANPSSGPVREYAELLGLLAYQLAVEAPPAYVKAAIMARVAAQMTPAGIAADEPAEAPPVLPFARTASTPRPFWRIAQATALAASLVGLGFMSATVRQQNRQIALLSSQAQAPDLDRAESSRVRNEMQSLRNRLDMITSVARQAYPLRTVAHVDAPRQPEGIVFVCGRHQQWYLSLHGLEPPVNGGEYHLWFMTERGKVDGGVLDVRPGGPAEMEAQTMPAGTHGFLVTLERRDQPESLTILLGENPINL